LVSYLNVRTCEPLGGLPGNSPSGLGGSPFEFVTWIRLNIKPYVSIIGPQMPFLNQNK